MPRDAKCHQIFTHRRAYGGYSGVVDNIKQEGSVSDSFGQYYDGKSIETTHAAEIVRQAEEAEYAKKMQQLKRLVFSFDGKGHVGHVLTAEKLGKCGFDGEEIEGLVENKYLTPTGEEHENSKDSGYAVTQELVNKLSNLSRTLG